MAGGKGAWNSSNTIIAGPTSSTAAPPPPWWLPLSQRPSERLVRRAAWRGARASATTTERPPRSRCAASWRCAAARWDPCSTQGRDFLWREKSKKREQNNSLCFLQEEKKAKKKERRAKLRQECSKAMPCTTTCVSLKTVLALGRKNTEHLAARGMT